jgi:SlyX protein
MGDMEERITELELRFMHQEHTIQELNETVYRQEQVIVRLERDFSLIAEQLRMSAASSGREPEGDERPPHY